MNELNISTIIAQNRREKAMTQEQLASYMGVSKASVSKWETGQSYPDITFLPQLATLFNISIDQLMGYSPQMTKEEIRKLYQRFSKAFAEKPLEDVLEELRETERKYYSCFPLLYQLAALLINHFMLTEDRDRQLEILAEAEALCARVAAESKDPRLSREAVSLQAMCLLISQQPEKVLELLGEDLRPMVNDETGLAQAYLMLGNADEARRVTQVSVYQHLLIFMSTATTLLSLQPNQFDMLLKRLLITADTFELEKLHPNTMALLYLQGAQGYCQKLMVGTEPEPEKAASEALGLLKKYTDLCTSGFFPYSLHGDDLFTDLDSWFADFDLGNGYPRSEKVIRESMLQGVEQNPFFTVLQDQEEFRKIVSALKANLIS